MKNILKSFFLIAICILFINANTITQSTSSKIVFETFNTLTPNATYTGAFTYGGTWAAKTLTDTAGVTTNIALLNTTNGTADWFSYQPYKFGVTDTVCTGAWVYSTAAGSGGIGGPNLARIGNQASDNNLQTAVNYGSGTTYFCDYNNSNNLQYSLGFTLAGRWFYLKGFWSGTPGYKRFIALNENYDTLYTYGVSPWTMPTPTSSDWATGIKSYTNNGKVLYDDVGISTGVTLTVNGLAAGMKYNFVGANNYSFFGGTVGAVSPTVNTIFKPIPMIGKWNIYGTDGNLLYADSSNVEVYGGDTWTYSGDITGATPTPIQTATYTPTATPAGGCFDSYVTTQTSAITTTSQTFEDTGLAFTFYAPVTTSAFNVIAVFGTSPSAGSNTRTSQFRFMFDSTPDTNYAESGTVAPDEDIIKYTKIFPVTTTGNHTIKLQQLVDNGSQQRIFNSTLMGHALYSWNAASGQLPYSTMNIDNKGATLTATSYVKVTSCSVTLTHPGKLSVQGYINGKWGGGTNTRDISLEVRVDGNTSSIASPLTKSLLISTDKTTLGIQAVSPILSAGSHEVAIWGKTSNLTREIVAYNGNIAVIGLVTNQGVILDANSTTATARQTITSSTFTNLVNAFVGLTLGGISKIMYLFSGDVTTTGVGTDASTKILLDNVAQGENGEVYAHSSGYEIFYNGGITGYNAQTYHGIQAQGKSNDGSSSMSFGNTDLVAYELCSELAPTATNTATITPTITVTMTSTATVTPTITPAWQLTKTSDKTNYNVGDTAEYTLSWGYTGYLPNATLSDWWDNTSPACFTFLSAVPAATVTPLRAHWDTIAGTSQSGAYKVYIRINEPSGRPWQITNTGEFQAVTGATTYADHTIYINTYTVTPTVTKTVTNTTTPTNTPTVTPTNTTTSTYTITPTYTSTMPVRVGYPYILKITKGLTPTPVPNVVCWASTINAYAGAYALPYTNKKGTDARGQIVWNFFNTGTYYVWQESNTVSAIATFVISENTFVDSIKGSGTGTYNYTFQLKDINTKKGVPGIACWLTTTNSRTGTAASYRVLTDSGGYITWKIIPGTTYYIWSETSDTSLGTILYNYPTPTPTITLTKTPTPTRTATRTVTPTVTPTHT